MLVFQPNKTNVWKIVKNAAIIFKETINICFKICKTTSAARKRLKSSKVVHKISENSTRLFC